MERPIEDCINKLIAKEQCMSRETSGIDTDCNFQNCDNCDLCYEQGTMGEQKEALKFAVETMRKYQMFQAQYVERLRADMAAMITELQLDIEELKSYESSDGQDLVMLADIGTLFQQKINNLKED